ncbi:MAG TPA: hypothetical protein VKB80_25310 [Kofleriaceae bacterium]|nr:hypothetical protein [Kofleriaceae bacterium]
MVPRRFRSWTSVRARSRAWSLVAAAAALAPAAARAQTAPEAEFPAITGRDYTLDLDQGAVLGSVQIVGMAGTAVATGVGSAGSLFNPAAVAVRPESSSRHWDWDWHFDYLSSAVGTDFDNNGIEQSSSYGLFDGPLLTAGIVGQLGPWGLGATILYYKQPIEQSADVDILPQTTIARVALARSFLGDEITAGVGARAGQFRMSRVDTSGSIDRSTDLFSINGVALEAGGLWRPPDRDVRVGLTGSLPVNSEQVEVAACDPEDCEGYILPERAALPWQVSIGAAWRRAPTRWNRKIRSQWRDEKYLLLAADLVVTGHVPSGYGVEAFAAREELQPSGRDVGISPRAGVEYEWVPGRFRIRGGSYWEPSRFRDPEGSDISGRLHVTLGLDVRVWSFCFWNERYRVRLSLTSDGARHYGNGGISIGFWH